MTKRFSFIVSFFVVCILYACHEKRFNPNRDITLDSFAPLSVDMYKMSNYRINKQLGELIKGDTDKTSADYHARSHYLSGGTLLWVTRNGVTDQADTLLHYLKTVDDIGFSQSSFFVVKIEEDLRKIKNLEFDKDDDISEIAARLDYNLTKAYLRYLIGQRYGFVNPRRLFNSLDKDVNDSTGRTFRQLYDVKTKTVRNKDVDSLLSLIKHNGVSETLRNSETQHPLYKKLKSLLPHVSGEERMKVLVNMERCRWRTGSTPFDYKKYVFVNLPSYGLLAVDGDDVLSMKVVSGSHKTKTPLLDSRITRMDINPKWIIPTSIVKREISLHAGDYDYFERNNYVIKDRTTGIVVSPENLSQDDFKSGKYRVVQDGGEGNALGRIIFRFNNNFSIFLHDTSSRSAFNRTNRSVSHGCIRVEKAYELACFLLSDKNTKILEKLKYSMQIRTRVPDDAEKDAKEYHIDKSKLLHSLSVNPQVPIFISYFTKWLMPDGQLVTYNDVYGYDEVIARQIREYIR